MVQKSQHQKLDKDGKSRQSQSDENDRERVEKRAPGHGDIPRDGDKPAPEKKAEQDRKLNEALKGSFPASDPPSSGQATGREKPKSRIDRPPADLSHVNK